MTFAKVSILIAIFLHVLDNFQLEAADADVDEVALLQTDLTMTPGAENTSRSKTSRTSPSRHGPGTEDGSFAKVWAWLTQHQRDAGGEAQAIDSTRPFHRHFIAVSLLMLCVLPWAQSKKETGDAQEGTSDWTPRRLSSKFFSVCFHPCYLSVLVLWLKHYWFRGSFVTSEALVMFAGFMLDYEGRCHGPQDDMRSKYCNLIPERFTRLYPFYALYVILYPPAFSWMGRMCNLFWESPSVEAGHCYQLCCGLAWLFSVLLGCYILVPLFTGHSREMAKEVVLVLAGACVALVLLPRTLTSTMRPRLVSHDKAMQLTSGSSGETGGLIFMPESLLSGLVNFFIGILCARVWLAVKLRSLAPFLGTKSNDEQAEVSCESVTKSKNHGRSCQTEASRPDHVLSDVELLQLLGPLRAQSAAEYANGNW